MDLSSLTGLGLEVNMPVAIATIFFSSFVFKFVKSKSENGIIHIAVPFVIAMVETLLWDFSHTGIAQSSAWNALWNAIVAIGMYSPIESFMRKQGWIK